MFKKSILYTVLSSILLTGCAGVGIPEDQELVGKEIIPPAIEKLERVPSITKIKSKSINIMQRNEIPSKFLKQKIELSLSREATFEDLNEILNTYNMNLYFTEDVDSESELYIKNFSGTIGELLEVVSSIYNISFNHHKNGIIFVEEKSSYIINIPQDEDIISEVISGIETVGAEEVESSLLAGTIIYKANPINQEKIKSHIERFKKNAAIIGLQVAIVTVTMDKNNNRGFDWSKFQANFGQGVGTKLYSDTLSKYGVSNSSGSSSEDNSSSGSSSSSLGNSLDSIKSFMEVSSAGSALSLMKGDFTFNSVINYLSTYGQTKTNQSVLMRTLSGKEVSLRSGQSIPYVSGVSNTSSGSSGNVSSSTETDTAEIGITLELKPYFDSSSQMITTGLSLDLSSILSFLELSAGNAIGTITQPNTQDQSFTNIITVPAGVSTVVGGITYESISDNRTGIAYVEKAKIANKNQATNRSAVFILFRPTVTVFVDE